MRIGFLHHPSRLADCRGHTRESKSHCNAPLMPQTGHLRSHAFRHTYRTWLDSVGTSVGVQQKLMRHADIRTTMNIYGDVATPDMREAHGKIVGLALNGMGNGMEGKLNHLSVPRRR
ncbi:MAG: hypothetical protein DMG97_39230 [Acidobacteria bacterium]|nr:MAG: hypothetical protein DMG97_39230 [Acidobacteriota bacterium]